MMFLFLVGLLGACSNAPEAEAEAGGPTNEVCTCVVDTYDPEGELTTTHLETYDGLGRLIRWEGTSSVGWTIVDTWTYEGELLVGSTSQVDESFEAIHYEHDDQGRFVLANYDEGTQHGLRIEFDYNAFGLASSRRTDSDGNAYSETAFHWDEDGRLLGWDTVTDNGWVSGATRSYDATGPSLDHVEVRSYSNQDPQSSERWYGSSGKLVNETVVGSFGTETQWGLAYDSDGRLAEVSYDDGHNPTIVAYTYDAAGREVSRVSTPSEDGALGGSIERAWQHCGDQPALAPPTVPGVQVTLANPMPLTRF